MYIESHFVEPFKQFCAATGNSEFKYPESVRQPDMVFEWIGDIFWAYKKAGGYEIFGENVEILENTWDAACSQLFERKDENKSG